MTKNTRFLKNIQKTVEEMFNPVFRIYPGTWLVNIIVQRFFFVNRKTPWMVHYTSKVQHAKNIQLGENVWKSFATSGGCYVQGLNGIFIGDYTIFAPGVKIISANHDTDRLDKWLPSDPIRIGHHCWIGTNAVILAGVSLGDRCVVGAGAVVTKSYPAGSVLGGVPARLLKTIDTVSNE